MPESVQSLVYLSNGNIPSRWAHTMQLVKMAEAFSCHLQEVKLLTQIHPLLSLLPAINFSEWHGVGKDLSVCRLWNFQAPCRRVFTHVFDESFIPIAMRAIRRLKPDLVYTRYVQAAESVSSHGLSCVVECHSHPSSDQAGLLSHISTRDSVRKVVTISRALANAYESLGVPSSKLLVLPDAVDQQRFSNPLSQEEARAVLELPQSRFTVAYTGHLYPEKGRDVLLQLPRLLPDVQFVIVGGWPEDSYTAQKIASKVANLRVVSFKPNSQLPLYLWAADTLLLPNSAQHAAAAWTSPLKLFEYQAAGRALIASRLPAFSDYLKHEENCLLATPDDPHSFVAAIKRLRQHPDLAEKLARQGNITVSGRTWKARARTILDALQG